MSQRESVSEAIQRAQALLGALIRELVDEPTEVQIDTVEGGQAVIFEANVALKDMKRVIGRRGRTATAIRELMTNMGCKAGRRYIFELVEPLGLGVKPEDVESGPPRPVPLPEITHKRLSLQMSVHHED